MRKPISPSRSVTQEDVAKKAGVSRSIVSYVLNDGPRPVAEATRMKILEAIKELDYRPNKYARSLTKSCCNEVAEKYYGIIMSDVFMLRRPYYAEILAGIHDMAHEDNRHIRFIRFFDDLKDPLLFNELIHKEEVSGLILIALDQSLHNAADTRLVEQIQERINNIVCVEWELEGTASVGFNRQEAAFKACNHLITKGLSDIFYIGPQDNRILGYRQALFEAGIPHDENTVINGSNISDGFNACRNLIHTKNLPKALLGGTDEVSFGILRALDSEGLRVPEDVSLVSIDNIEISGFTNPPLTTVDVDTWEMGRLAVQTLMRYADKPNTAPATTLLPTRLIVRDSCR